MGSISSTDPISLTHKKWQWIYKSTVSTPMLVCLAQKTWNPERPLAQALIKMQVRSYSLIYSQMLVEMLPRSQISYS